MGLRFAGGVEGDQAEVFVKRGDEAIAGGAIQAGILEKFNLAVSVEFPEFGLEGGGKPKGVEATGGDGGAVSFGQFGGGAIGVAIDHGESGFAREKAEAGEGLPFLRGHFEGAERFAFLEPCEAFVECGAFEIDGPFFFLEAFETALGLIEIGKDQLALDAFNRGEDRSCASGESRG